MKTNNQKKHLYTVFLIVVYLIVALIILILERIFIEKADVGILLIGVGINLWFMMLSDIYIRPHFYKTVFDKEP